MIGYRFVHDHRAEHRITDLCRVAGVNRSGYYAWIERPMSDHDLDDAYLANEIHGIHARSRGTYGAPRVAGQLRRAGRQHGRKRVARVMAECGFVGAHSRRRWRQGRANTAPAPDLLNRDFTAEASNQRWVADITEFKCIDGKLYLAGIKDLHDQGLAGWSMGNRRPADLVVNALIMALARRQPDGDVVHHADRAANTPPSSSPTRSPTGT